MDLECKQYFCAIKITETVTEPKKKKKNSLFPRVNIVEDVE